MNTRKEGSVSQFPSCYLHGPFSCAQRIAVRTQPQLAGRVWCSVLGIKHRIHGRDSRAGTPPQIDRGVTARRDGHSSCAHKLRSAADLSVGKTHAADWPVRFRTSSEDSEPWRLAPCRALFAHGMAAWTVDADCMNATVWAVGNSSLDVDRTAHLAGSNPAHPIFKPLPQAGQVRQ